MGIKTSQIIQSLKQYNQMRKENQGNQTFLNALNREIETAKTIAERHQVNWRLYLTA